MSENGAVREARPAQFYTFREFRFPDDYQAVLALWSTAGPGVHIGRSDTPEEILKKQQRDPDLFLLAVAGERVIGTVMGGFDGRRGMIYHLAVAQEARNQGVGAALMTEVERRLHEKGCLRSYLLVTSENRSGQAFYAAHGWERMEILVYGKNLGGSV